MEDKTIVCKDCGTEFVFNNSMLKKDLQMSHKGVLFVEKQEKNKEEIKAVFNALPKNLPL